MINNAPEPTDPEVSSEPEAAQEPPQGPNAEAAKYRTQLRESQALNATLQTRIDGLLRGQADRHAADALAVPADLFDFGGVTLADVLDDSGDVDPDKIAEATRALLTSRPGLAKAVRSNLDFGAGNRGEPPRETRTGWTQVLGKDRDRR